MFALINMHTNKHTKYMHTHTWRHDSMSNSLCNSLHLLGCDFTVMPWGLNVDFHTFSHTLTVIITCHNTTITCLHWFIFFSLAEWILKTTDELSNYINIWYVKVDILEQTCLKWPRRGLEWPHVRHTIK